VSEIDLTQLNVWLDVVFTSLYVVILIALSLHFIVGNVFVSGRAKRRFVNWEWPHHEGPPITFLPKFLHFQHVVSMILLAVSGLYIRFPGFLFPWDNTRTAMRYIHYVAMIVVTINLFVRLWYAFGSARRDYREFAITKQDVVTMPKVILYYIFVKSSKPHLGKYNVMQKATYTIFAPLLMIQAYTGFALLTAPFMFGYSPRYLLLGGWLPFVESVDLIGWYARTAHYAVNWLFIILTTIHVYLSVSEDFPAFLNFFGLSAFDRENTSPVDHGEHGDHGHAPSPALADSDS
jgi:Ni,Fe-hydrogenase I cytochrome b subunit